MRKSPSVSFKLYSTNGSKINKSLCANTTTDLKIPLKNLDSLNLKKIDAIAKRGYEIFNSNSTYFNDRCIPIRGGDEAETIQGRRKDFQNLTFGCAGGCQFGGINTTTGYANCNCKTSSTSEEIGTKFVNKILDSFNSTNIEIMRCFKTVFSYVNKI